MFYQHLLHIIYVSKKVYIAIYPLPLVYGLYTCESVDNCEQPLNKQF